MELREEHKLNSSSIQFEDDESRPNIPKFSAIMREGGIMSQS
jgi:hypothetical protein